MWHISVSVVKSASCFEAISWGISIRAAGSVLGSDLEPLKIIIH